jgi:hypothetical protein
MLILGAFCGHVSEELKITPEGKNCDLVVSLDGMSSQLQLCHVLIKSKIKSEVIPVTGCGGS